MGKVAKLSERKEWIDTARGVAMLAIVLFHSDVYLVGEAVISYDLYVVNALTTFFIISGYLFHKERFDLKAKLTSVVRHLVVPYFLFTVLMALPKAYVHDSSIAPAFLSIICGQASWFVAALIVAEIIFSLLLSLSQRCCRPFVLPVSCILIGAIPFCINSDMMHFWYADVALMALVYLYLGYFYHFQEKVFDEHLHIKWCLLMLVVVVFLKGIEQHNSVCMSIIPSSITSVPIFFVDTTLSALTVITISKRFHSWCAINFVGRNSLVFYFLCGGVPMFVGVFLRHIGLSYGGNYLVVLLAFCLSVAIITLFTFLIIRYLPFMVGRRRG